MRRRWRELLLVALLAAAPLCAYAPALREGRVLAPGDGAALHLPLRVEVFRAWQRGEVPSWNASIFSGTPLAASYRPGAFHPLMLALSPLHPLLAFQLLVLGSLALSGALAYLYARRLGAGPVGALLAGLGFALGPHLVEHLGDTATIVAAPALPLLLLATERQLSRPRHELGAMAALAGAVALVLLAGSREAALAAALLTGARLALAFLPRLARGDAADLPRVASTLAAVVAGVLLAAPQLLPTLGALREAGAGAAGAADPPAAPLSGVAGFVVRYVSHTPAPIFALSAVPLLGRVPALRAAAAVVLLVLLLFALRGSPGVRGALPLAFDLALALLAGLALSQQWEARLEPWGRRVRRLALVAALFAAASLSVATTVTGPLAPELQAPVGLLALALILHFALAGSQDRVYAHLFLLPLAVSFLLQPLGRQAWATAPTLAELAQPTPTRAALERVMGERRSERLLSLSADWPHARARDLAWANLASLSGHRNANGYDPLVPRARLDALGLRADGTATRALLETDPGRLELLGVRWVQVPTATLAVAANASGLGEALDVVLEPPRPHLFALPITRATEVRLLSFLSGAVDVPDGRVVAECTARLASGREVVLEVRAGRDTAEWAWDRADLVGRVRHARPPVHAHFTTGRGIQGNQYLATLPLGARYAVRSLRLRALPGAPPLRIVRAGLYDTEIARGTGFSTAAAFVSDEVRLAEAAATPLVSLFEVRRGIGEAWVVDGLRRLPDLARVLDVLRAPTRLGVDTRREALVAEADVHGVELPPGSRSQPADVARAEGGTSVVRAAGPGLLVIGESYDRGFEARVDGVPTRVLRVNADRLGVVLQEGTHRIVLTHRARGLAAGVATSGLTTLLLVLGSLRALARV